MIAWQPLLLVLTHYQVTHLETSPTHYGLPRDISLFSISVLAMSPVTDNDLSYFLPRCRNRWEEATCPVPREKISPTSLLQWLALIEKHPWYPLFPSGGRSSPGVSKVRKGERGEYLGLQKSVQTHCFSTGISWLSTWENSIRNQVWRGHTTKSPSLSFSQEATPTYLTAVCLNCHYSPSMVELHRLPSSSSPMLH